MVVNTAMLSTSERNNMGRERLLTCLSECGAEHEPVVLLELQKVYFNRYEEYLNKAELRKFFSKGHIKQVFENFMPKDVEMATDVNATGSLFLKMKRSLQVALADTPKAAPLMAAPKINSETNRPNLVPLPPPPVEQPVPSRKVLPVADKFKTPLVPSHRMLPPNRKESFSLTGGFGGNAVEASDDLLEDFVPRGGNNDADRLVAYEAKRETANGKPATGTASTEKSAAASMARRPMTINASIWEDRCVNDDETMPKSRKDSRSCSRRRDVAGDREDDFLETSNEAEEESELGDSALEDGYQQLKRQAAKKGDRAGQVERSSRVGGTKSLTSVAADAETAQSRRRRVVTDVSDAGDDGADNTIGKREGVDDHGGGSLLEEKWAAERRARDALITERLRSRKRDPQQYNDDWNDDEQLEQQMEAGEEEGKRNNRNVKRHFGIDGSSFIRAKLAPPPSATMRRTAGGSNGAKPKKALSYGLNRFRDVPPPFAPNVMSSEDDEEEEGKEEMNMSTNNNKKKTEDGAVQASKDNSNTVLQHRHLPDDDEDGMEEEEDEGPMVTMNRTDEDDEEEDSAALDNTPEELRDEETEQFYQQFSNGSNNDDQLTTKNNKSKQFSDNERNKFIGMISTVMSMLKNANHTDLDAKLASLSPSGAYRKAFSSAAVLLSFITNHCPNIIAVKVSKQDVALLWSERSEELMTLLLQEAGKMVLKKSGKTVAGVNNH